MSKILNGKYALADLREVANANAHLTDNQKEKLHLLLLQHEPLFDGTLGKWEGNPCHVELRKGAKTVPCNSVQHSTCIQAHTSHGRQQTMKSWRPKKIN